VAGLDCFRDWQAPQLADLKAANFNANCLQTTGSWVQILPGAPSIQVLAKAQVLAEVIWRMSA
jgi:hypothetical protein